jgi:hypothetical protein
MRRFWIALILPLMLACPVCGGRWLTPADGTSVAASRVLPPIPSSAPTALGPIPIRRVHDLHCDSVPAYGCFHRNTWVIELRDSMPLPLAWVSLHHELAHAAFQVAGIEFDDAAEEDRIADAIGNAQVVEMRAGWPR